MRTITALLIAGVVLTGGMAAMAADLTGPDVAAPVLVDPGPSVSAPVADVVDIPPGEEAVDPGPVDAGVEAPEVTIDDVGDPVTSDAPVDPSGEEAVDPGPTEGGAGGSTGPCTSIDVCDDIPEDTLVDPPSEGDPEQPADECPDADSCDPPTEECPESRICDEGDVPGTDCSGEFCEQIIHGPVALNDEFDFEASPSPVVLPVLANDSDPDGDELRIVEPFPSVEGLECDELQCRIIRTTADTVSFRYVVSDGVFQDQASVTVRFFIPENREPQPQDDVFDVGRGFDPVELDVLANDSDLDGDSLFIVGNSDPSLGSVECSESVCVFVPGSELGTTRFEYTVSDGELEASALVTVNIVNLPPVAAADEFDVFRGTEPVELDVLANDSDPDGDPLTVLGIGSSPPPGLLECGPASCRFVPGSEVRTVSFVYVVSDGELEELAEVRVNIINRAPEPSSDEFEVAAGSGPVDLDVLANDSDPDGDPLTIVGNDDPDLGSVECDSTSCSFTPGSDAGTTTFEYTVSDGDLEASAVVTVTIPDPSPLAVADEFEVNRGSDAVDLDVLANDSDPDGDPLTIVGNDDPDLGSVGCDSTSCSFTPGSEVGTTTFAYTISDGSSEASAVVTVNIINRAPVAVDDDYTVQLSDGLVALPLLGNDSDPDGDVLTIVGDPTSGLGLLDCGTTTCTFRADRSGTESFVYTISDGLDTASATVTLRVPEVPVDPPPGGPEDPPPPTGPEGSPDEPAVGPAPPDAPEPPEAPEAPEAPDSPPRSAPREPEAPETRDSPPRSAPREPEASLRGVRPGTPGVVGMPPIVSAGTGVVANSAPNSGSALSLVTALWLLAPIAALLRRRRHDPSSIDHQGE